MTTTSTRSQGSYVDRPSSSSLADVVEMILDKGLVIDAYVRVSLVGIEILTIDARIVIASVDTYLRFAEATNRLDLAQQGGKDLTELMEGVTEADPKAKLAARSKASKKRSLQITMMRSKSRNRNARNKRQSNHYEGN